MSVEWLPEGKVAAVVWSIDDVHPGRSTDAYEAGGDLDRGALGYVGWLLDRHAQLRVTLFVTADWRETSPFPTRKLRARLPRLSEHMYLAPTLPRGTMALDHHPDFTRFLASMPRTEIALHGLEHVHRGHRLIVEFQDESPGQMHARLRRAAAIFDRAGVKWSPGLQPPGWDLPPALESAAVAAGLQWVASARDIETPIDKSAVTNMSGLPDASLIYPERLGSGLIHFTSNFQATSPIERAHAIVEDGGLLAIKAHIVKSAFGHIALDGVDSAYMNYLDLLFRDLERIYGDHLWWTTMGDIANRLAQH